jgi:nitrite reductase/ring-hydroxylating ferredoxin subunit
VKTKIVYFSLLAVILLTVFVHSCKDKEDLVPQAYVNFTISLADPEFADLQTVGNSILVTGGVCGIVLFRLSQDEFVALERNCTYQPSDRCAVAPDSSGLILRCPCCSSFFSISNGTHMGGEARRPLILYNTSFDGLYLQVYN